MKILSDSNIDTYNKNKKDGIKINIIGLRPGEKLHEELYHPEKILQSTNNKIFQESCDINISVDEINEIKDKIKLSNSGNDLNILQGIFSKYIKV
tara:strand:- start:367 stop:651 length:285 start_codon:yes stop_codon:yes gene_type:complete